MRRYPMRFATRLPLWSLVLLLVVSAAPKAAGQQEAFNTLILSPEPGEIVPQTTTLVSLSFADPDRILDVGSVRLVVDRADLSADATINGDVLVWVPRTVLSRGVHNVVVTMRARDGSGLSTVSWSFIVGAPPPGVSVEALAVPEERKGLPSWAMLQGNVVLEGSMNSVGGEGANLRRETPYTGKAWVNARGRLGGSWRYSARTHLNSYESHVRQPINRFNFNLQSNWLRLAVGDVNPRLHELILWGRRVRGWSLDLRGGIVNLAIVSGQSRRAVEAQLYSDDLTRVFRRGTFAQDLFAVRPYFGSGRGVQFGITFMKVRDDMGSITDLRTTAAAGDTSGTVSANPKPRDNLVAGLDFSLRAFTGKLSLSYSNAISFLTNDISGGPITESDLDSLAEEWGFEVGGMPSFLKDPEKIENIFILNESSIPLDLPGRRNLAHQARGTLQLGGHTLGVRWRSVGGSYNTLGYSSLQKDRSGFRIQDTFRLLENRLGVTVGWEKYNDNLGDTKPATTGTSALTVDMSWQGDVNAPGFTMGLRSYGRRNGLTDASQGGIDENTNTYSAGAFLPVSLVGGLRSRLSINYVSVGREDRYNDLTGTNNTYYLIGFNGRFEDRPTEFSVTYGLNTSELTGWDAQTTFHRILLRGRHAFTAQLAGTADMTMTRATSPVSTGALGLDYNKWDLTGGAEYYWSPTSFASLRAGFVSYTDNRRTDVDTTQLVLRLRLTQAF